MKQFIDFIPLLLFFIVFKLDPRTVEFAGQSIELGGIFSATGVLIASSVVVYGTLFAVQKRLEKGQWLREKIFRVKALLLRPKMATKEKF